MDISHIFLISLTIFIPLFAVYISKQQRVECSNLTAAFLPDWIQNSHNGFKLSAWQGSGLSPWITTSSLLFHYLCSSHVNLSVGLVFHSSVPLSLAISLLQSASQFLQNKLLATLCHSLVNYPSYTLLKTLFSPEAQHFWVVIRKVILEILLLHYIALQDKRNIL